MFPVNKTALLDLIGEDRLEEILKNNIIVDTGEQYDLNERVSDMIINTLREPTTESTQSRIQLMEDHRKLLMMDEKEYYKMKLSEICTNDFHFFYRRQNLGEWDNFVLMWVTHQSASFIECIDRNGIHLMKNEHYKILFKFIEDRAIFDYIHSKLKGEDRIPPLEQRTIAYYYYYQHASGELEYMKEGKLKWCEEIAKEHNISAQNFRGEHYNKIENSLEERTNPSHHKHLLAAIDLLLDHPKAQEIAEEELRIMERKS